MISLLFQTEISKMTNLNNSSGFPKSSARWMLKFSHSPNESNWEFEMDENCYMILKIKSANNLAMQFFKNELQIHFNIVESIIWPSQYLVLLFSRVSRRSTVHFKIIFFWLLQKIIYFRRSSWFLRVHSLSSLKWRSPFFRRNFAEVYYNTQW